MDARLRPRSRPRALFRARWPQLYCDPERLVAIENKQAYRPDSSRGLKSAAQGELVCILEGAKQAVPPSNVPIPESVDIKLMMDGVMFRR